MTPLPLPLPRPGLGALTPEEALLDLFDLMAITCIQINKTLYICLYNMNPSTSYFIIDCYCYIII